MEWNFDFSSATLTESDYKTQLNWNHAVLDLKQDHKKTTEFL